jgi:hypothetical protein
LRKRFLATFVAVVLTIAGGITTNKASASPADEYTGTHFGLGNIPPGCEGDSFKKNPDDPAPRLDNACYHMRTGMNGLDSSDVDVLIMVPASPTATRDMRIIKQAVEMWQGGIHYLAPQMGVPWMKNMKFHISTTIEGAAAGDGFVTYPIVDPEIVIVSSNPVGGAGIGIDPWATYPGAITGQDAPCAGISNPFDTESWKGMPGYDHHGNEDGATVTEDCGGAGGNICFALTPAIDPNPPALDVFNLFDLVAHEFGHCLTIGHVGDGAEDRTNGGPWSKVPTTDIMSYNTDPPGLNKCVSTLDVEGIAVTQSHYIDTNGDHVVDAADHVEANEKEWDTPAANGGNHFQVQHPRDHFYASGTGDPLDCPQPDLGILPGTPTNWQPDPVTTSTNELTVTSPSDGATAADGDFNVTGTVEHKKINNSPPPPTDTAAAVDDGDSDATTPLTELLDFSTRSTITNVETTVHVAQLPPTSDVPSGTAYSVEINGHSFDSFAVEGEPLTWDARGGAYLPTGASAWDTTTNTVTFRIPRDYLHAAGVDAPYYVRASASYGGIFGNLVIDDRAPDDGSAVGIAGSRTMRLPEVGVSMQTIPLTRDGGNHFDSQQSMADGRPVFQGAGVNNNSHYFTLDVPEATDVALTLNWTDGTGASDLDMYVTGTGGVDSGTDAASAGPNETYSLHDFKGALSIEIAPYLIADAVNGVDYTLTAVLGTQAPPELPPAPSEHVHVYLDDATTPLASASVDTLDGPDDFAIAVNVPDGDHTLRVEWERFGKVVATKSVNVTAGTPETTTSTTSTTTATGNGHGDEHGNDDEHGHNGHGGPNAGVVAVPVKR